MLATPGRLPADDELWSYEVKFDGVRVLTYIQQGSVRCFSRNGNEITAAYPELQRLGDQVGTTPTVLDGEVVVIADGRTDFGRLQNRIHVRRPSAELIRSTPVTLLLFDLLHRGSPTLDWTYDQRRAALTDLQLTGGSWSTPRDVDGDGPTILEQTRLAGLEGVVVKRRDSTYLPGTRARSWVKVKHVRRASVVVVGWKPGERGRAGQIGALLLGVHGPDGLEYADSVGTGFTQATLARLQRLLDAIRVDQSPLDTPIPASDARGATWVQPRYVADVDFTEWTRTGALRHPSFKGLRDDIDPSSVSRGE